MFIQISRWVQLPLLPFSFLLESVQGNTYKVQIKKEKKHRQTQYILSEIHQKHLNSPASKKPKRKRKEEQPKMHGEEPKVEKKSAFYRSYRAGKKPLGGSI